jgi:gas vesicle protein
MKFDLLKKYKRKQQQKHALTAVVAGFFGATAALLFSPAKGEVNRKAVATTSKKLLSKWQAKFSKIKQNVAIKAKKTGKVVTDKAVKAEKKLIEPTI